MNKNESMNEFDELCSSFSNLILKYKWNNESLKEAKEKGPIKLGATPAKRSKENVCLNVISPQRFKTKENSKQYDLRDKRQKENVVVRKERVDLSIEEDSEHADSFVVSDSLVDDKGEEDPEEGETLKESNEEIESEEEEEGNDSFVVSDDVCEYEENQREYAEEKSNERRRNAKKIPAKICIDLAECEEEAEDEEIHTAKRVIEKSTPVKKVDETRFATPIKTGTRMNEKEVGSLKKKSEDAKLEIARNIFCHYNKVCFGNLLPADLPISFNKNLRKTAGYTKLMRRGEKRLASIDLSTKVLDTAFRLRQ